jgi:Sugar (and other) transporter
LLVLEPGVCVQIDDTLDDIASGEVGDEDHRLSLSLARDIVGRAPGISAQDISPDAELIALCDRIVAINAEQTAIFASYPGIDQEADDNPVDGPVLDAVSAEWHEIKRRITDLSIVRLPAPMQRVGRLTQNRDKSRSIRAPIVNRPISISCWRSNWSSTTQGGYSSMSTKKPRELPIGNRPAKSDHSPIAGRAAPCRRKAVIAATVGTTIEWYDFFIYGTAAGLIFPKLFLPNEDPLTGTLAAFSTYSIGFVGRPIGAAIFGHYGDRIGRKVTLIATLMVMGIATFLVAFVRATNRLASGARSS